ncbi:MAG: hypothetical protein RIT26_1346 [Pseudomonadota bacterium]|jgi:hypothetical protein
MRHVLISLTLAVAFSGAGWASAQTAGTQTQVEAKSKKPVKPKPKKAADRAAAATPVAASEPSAALTPELQMIADQIHTGKLPCEMGQTVTLLHDAHEAGRFNLFIKNHVYHLTPVRSATGAIRLEDPVKGAVWIQLSDKSMLMNSQLGQRMADVCQSPSQLQVAQAQKLAPPPSLLEPLPGNGLAQK